MPQFKIAKTDDIDKLNNNIKTEDKLYIYKETNKLGRIFYDYDENTRIEIGSFDKVYEYVDDSTNNLTDKVATVHISKLREYTSTGNSVTVDINNVQINSLVTTTNGIYNIRYIDRYEKIITLVRLHIQHDLMWNDYY